MLEVAILVFWGLPREPVCNSILSYKDSVNSTGCVEVEIVVQHVVEATCTNF
jgi:hypothetical protein